MSDQRLTQTELAADEAKRNLAAELLRSVSEMKPGQVHVVPSSTNGFLIVGASLTAFAAALHLGCIAFGAPWYRFFGAGEEMAQLASAGSWQPAVITLAIATVLAGWSLYALSGAGLIRRLPLLRLGLCAIAGIYLFRGVAFLPFMARFPDRSIGFWLWSSLVCLALGAIHLIGICQSWRRLSSTR